MSGLSDSLTVGKGGHIGIVQTVIGKPGAPPDLGSLEQALVETLSLSGMPEVSTQAIAQRTMKVTLLWFQAWLESYILATQKQPTEPKKPESTSTSESQNEEVG